MDVRVKELLEELGNAINDAVSNSSTVEAILQKIRDHGYEVYLTLEANIAIEDKRDDHNGFTKEDLNFLRKLKIQT